MKNTVGGLSRRMMGLEEGLREGGENGNDPPYPERR